ncbi:hypothetical protein P886_0017 [Alteromonadaceae bacterium 2753L.S.0a.02]|nr:hypothetical protein P886_0017 [Alteromonadaceae bacterium 2753L.S.0a.02]
MSVVDRLEPSLCGTGDIRLGKMVGMPGWEIRMLKELCDREALMLIIRACNPDNRQYMYKRGYAPKPVGMESKTSSLSSGPKGLVAADRLSSKDKQSIANSELKHYLQGKSFYSDYDLMSAWRRRNPNRCKKIDTNDTEFLYSLNSVVGLRFMHGGNDDYYNRQTGKFAGAGNVKPGEVFVVIGAYDKPFDIHGLNALKLYYQKCGCASDLSYSIQGAKVPVVVWPYV